jgi:flap endonuclease-1
MKIMGLKLGDLLEQYYVKKSPTPTLKNLTGKIITFDAFNTLYAFVSTIRYRDGTPLKNYNGDVTSHLSGLWNRNRAFLENSIKPIYVFDGHPDKRKTMEIRRRKFRKMDAQKKYEEAYDSGDEREMLKQAKRTPRVSSKMIKSSKELLRAMGIPFITAPQEAEAQCAYIVNSELAWAVATQDYDAFLFNSKRILRYLTASKSSKNEVQLYFIENFLNETKLTQIQLVDMGILIGLDFFEGIRGVGSKTAYKLISEHGDLETIIKKKVEIRKVPIYIDQKDIDEVREIFLNPVVRKDLPRMVWKRPKKEDLERILIEENNFSEESTKDNIEDFVRQRSSKQQISLDRFIKF